MMVRGASHGHGSPGGCGGATVVRSDRGRGGPGERGGPATAEVHRVVAGPHLRARGPAEARGQRRGPGPGRRADGGTSRQHARRADGALRITDLGYFSVAVFAAMVAAGEHFLSRLQYGTGVRLAGGAAADVLRWLAGQAGPLVDRPIHLG